jgi:hypothetical protein
MLHQLMPYNPGNTVHVCCLLHVVQKAAAPPLSTYYRHIPLPRAARHQPRNGRRCHTYKILTCLFYCLLQVVQEAAPPLSTYYRHISKGAWPFSSRDHGWPISDCTSEGFKAALGIAALGRTAVLSGPKVQTRDQRLCWGGGGDGGVSFGVWGLGAWQRIQRVFGCRDSAL